MHTKMFAVSTYRRAGTVLLALALLFGTVMSLLGMPVAANADTVKTFDADFSALTDLVDAFEDNTPQAGDEGLDVDVPVTGLIYEQYTPTAEDTAVNEWMTARFAMWANRENKFYGEKSYVGESSDALDGGDTFAGASNWALGHDGALCYTYTGKRGDQMLRKSATLTVKAENGMMAKLSNFEATVVFNEAFKGDLGAVFLLFHEEFPGQLNTKNFGKNFTGTSAAVVVGNDGSKDGILIRDSAANVAANTVTGFSSNLKNREDHTLYVRVEGTALTVKVTNAAGEEIYKTEKTVKAGSGYLSVGAANTERNIKSIHVVELNENGEPVDFGTETGPAYNDFRFDVTDVVPYNKVPNGDSGKYPASGQHYFTFADKTSAAATTAIDELNRKFYLYYNHDDKYTMAPAGKSLAYAGQTQDKAFFGTLLTNLWLQRNTGNRTTPHTALKRITSLVPKNKSGEIYRYRNLEAAFLLRFESASSVADGGAILGFRQKVAGQFTASASEPVKTQGFVLITKTGITVMAGEGVSPDAATANATAFSSALPQEVGVQIRVVGNTVRVKITDRYHDVVYYDAEHTIDYDAVGAIAYGITSRGHDIGDISLTHLDDSGKPIDIDFSTAIENEATAPGEKFTFTAENIEPYENDQYTASGADAIGMENVSDAAFNAVSSKFNFYFNHEANYKMVPPYGNEGNPDHGSGNWELSQNHWLRRTTPRQTGEYVRLVNALVPKDNYGNELTMTNLIASFDFRFEKSEECTSTALFGFRQKQPAKFVNAYGSMNTEQCIVAISPYSMDVAGGTDITRERFYKYSHQSIKMKTVYDDPLPEEIHVQIKAVGTGCMVTIYDITQTTELFSKNFTVNYTKSGYVAFGAATINGSFGNFSITRLDTHGEEIDIGDAESLQDCPWDTTVEPFEDAIDADTATDYDFYYSSAETATIKEPMAEHWVLNDDGVLMRQNHLSPNVTDSTAMLHWKGTEETKTLRDFDASFKLYLDGSETGTFWVTAGVKEANLGKIVTVPGNTDFIKGQLAVGVAVGGNITIAVGNGKSVTLKGPALGTATGTHFVRVKVANGSVSVYLNGVQYATRTLDASVGDGALCFGYSGAKLGIGGMQITKLDDNGVPIDLSSAYTAVNNPEKILVAKNTPYADIKALLPETLVVTGPNGNEQSKVFWDLSALDPTVEGETTVVGYLEATNGIRAEAIIRVGKYDDENTVIYNFSDMSDLDAFDTYYLPETATQDAPTFSVKNTDNDNWYIDREGKLAFKTNAWLKTLDEVKEGFTLNGVDFKDEYANVCNINTGIAVLKDKKYKNFILEVDFQNNSEMWSLVGFGAQANDANDVFWTQQNGGYTYSVYPSGSATLSGYSETVGSSDILSYAHSFFKPYEPGKGVHHLKMIVSGGTAYLYVDDFVTPAVVTLPAEYDKGNGGYIYFATNSPHCRFDNIKIVDLDEKPIELQSVVNKPTDMTVNREAGDKLLLPLSLDMVDVNGYTYTVPVKWESEDYRSHKNGVFTFNAVPTLTNATAADDCTCELQVDNRIGNDYDSSYTQKYYLDHENDLENFVCHYSMQAEDGSDNWTGDLGELVEVNATDYWTASGQKGATTSYIGAGGSYNERNKFRSVSSLVLKDLNLVNFRLEVDYTHGSNFWYPYVLTGVQDPSKFLGTLGFYDSGVSLFKYDASLGGGIYTYVEREGAINMYGAIDILSSHSRFSTDFGGATTLEKYSSGGTHHLTLTVVDGLLTVQLDDSALYFVDVMDEAIGGYVGIAGCGNYAGFSNFEITALDSCGKEVPLADAERGFAPTEPAPWVDGWIPPTDEYSFEWGSKYTH